jgi:predicted anti-sigma-YlaC factor YlaD
MTPQQVEQLAAQRQAARRARAQGRRWYLRSVLMIVVAVVAVLRGGQVYYILAGALVLLAAMAVSLGTTVRRQADAMEEKIDLMEHTSSEELGELSG